MLYIPLRALRLGLVACALAAASGAGAAHKAQNHPVAWVNGQPIARTTLVELLNLRNAPPDASGRPLPPVTREDRERALDDIVRLELLAQKAQAQGLTATPEAAAELEFQRDQVLGQRLLRLMTQETVIDEAALRERHAALPTEHEVTVRHILLADEAAARQALARLAAGEPFEQVAAAASLDKDSRERGGALPKAMATAFVPAFSGAVLALQPGQTTPQPVHTEFGWHVIRLDALRTLPPPPLEQAREWLAPQMVNEQVDRQVAAWREAADVRLLQALDDRPLADPRGDVATVNGRAISRVKLEHVVRARNGLDNPYAPVDPQRATLPVVGREATLDELVQVELLAQQARARKLDENPSVMAEAELQTKTAAGRLYERYVISQTRVRTDELKASYRTEVPATDFKVSRILVPAEADARALIDQLRQGASFASLAREHSTDEGSRADGGSLGWVTVQQLPPEQASAVRKLKPGRLAPEPLRSDAGWVVVRLDAVRPSARRPGLDEATAWLYPKLMHDKVQAQLDRLRTEADVRIEP